MTSIDDTFVIMYQFRLRQDFSLSEIIEGSYNHLCEKFGENGYSLSKIYFKDPEFESFIAETQRYAKDKDAFVKKFLQVNGVSLPDAEG